jgi:hypothetical protein
MSSIVVVLLCTIYFLLFILALSWLIWRPMRQSIEADICALKIEASNLKENPAADKVLQLLEKSSEQLGAGIWRSPDFGMAAWQIYLSAEIEMVNTYSVQRVRAELVRAVDELASAGQAKHSQLIAATKKALDGAIDEANDRSLLLTIRRAARANVADDDGVKTALYTKVEWLTYVSTLAVVVAAVAFGRWQFLLAGALGGLLSRMSRTVRATNGTSIEDARWTTLLTSPMLGALSGFAGLLLAQTAKAVGVLGPVIPDGFLDQESAAGPIGLALVFGFSERLFDSVVQSVENNVSPQSIKQRQPPGESPPPPVEQRQPPADSPPPPVEQRQPPGESPPPPVEQRQPPAEPPPVPPVE